MSGGVRGGVRPYQPVTPANNKYLAKRWDQEIFNTHRKKVAAAKAVIDNNPPTVHMHLHIKLKKLQFEAERLATIERDNRILLEKMAHIMRTGGLVDHKKHDYAHKSLNKTKRQRELLRITHENLAILKRLTTKDPHYNHKKWLLEWQVNQQYLMNISKYAHPWRQEQSPYESMVQRQTKANNWITGKVQSHQYSGSNRSSAKRSAQKPKISVSDTSTLVSLMATPTISCQSSHKLCDEEVKQEPIEPSENAGDQTTDIDIKIEPECDITVVNTEPPDITVVSTEPPDITVVNTEPPDTTVVNTKQPDDEGAPDTIPQVEITCDVSRDDIKEEEKMAPIPFTISEADYQQAVNVDLPKVETPAASPENPLDVGDSITAYNLFG